VLAARENERQRSWPVTGDELRGVARQAQIQPFDHVRARDEEQKWFAPAGAA
jgi:hypothetical protein